LSALWIVLKPDGAMQLMVYAPYGRAGIYMLQEFCRCGGILAITKDVQEQVPSGAAAVLINRAHA